MVIHKLCRGPRAALKRQCSHLEAAVVATEPEWVRGRNLSTALWNLGMRDNVGIRWWRGGGARRPMAIAEVDIVVMMTSRVVVGGQMVKVGGGGEMVECARGGGSGVVAVERGGKAD